MFSFSVITPAFAHPGRTDKWGCHTCKTSCKKWGLKYGQYHCHRGK
ncbi:MAG: YHYH domain-containing protein [Planctomycetes bacterium]|nr:YHYH domain-containing protein [Planctomycetota bacterium]